jgi:hypothetical protein
VAKKNTSDNPASSSAPKRAAASRRATKRPAADAVATAADMNTGTTFDGPRPTPDEIAQAAYQRYLSRGGGHGKDFDDWIEAERELASKR